MAPAPRQEFGPIRAAVRTKTEEPFAARAAPSRGSPGFANDLPSLLQCTDTRKRERPNAFQRHSRTRWPRILSSFSALTTNQENPGKITAHINPIHVFEA